MDTIEQRLHALEMAVGIRREVIPQIGMSFQAPGSLSPTTVLGTWAKPEPGERYWVVSSPSSIPYLLTNATLKKYLQDPRFVVVEKWVC